jgi:hypothetical protein
VKKLRISKKNLRMILGLILIVFGLLSFFNIVSPMRLLSTVIYPQHFWYQLFPDSTNSTNPSIISEGGTITLSIKLVYYDATNDIELPSPAYWDVSVSITKVSDGSLVQNIAFGDFDEVQGGVEIDGCFCSIAIWEEPWTVPAGIGEQYNFTWTVVIKDSAGTVYGTQTRSTYGKTADIEPDGTFKINGVDASQTSSIVVLDPDLVLDFVPIKNAEKIIAVVVQVWKGGVQIEVTGLTLQGDGSYRGAYQLPGPGTYELKGLIEWTDGPAIPKMSVLASYGETPPPLISVNQIIGGICMAAGAFLTLSDRIK